MLDAEHFLAERHRINAKRQHHKSMASRRIEVHLRALRATYSRLARELHADTRKRFLDLVQNLSHFG